VGIYFFRLDLLSRKFSERHQCGRAVALFMACTVDSEEPHMRFALEEKQAS